MVGRTVMFIGREKELQSLQARYESDRFEFIVIRGRRRVGKSRLLSEFCKDKGNVISFTAQERNKWKNLVQLSRAVSEYFSLGNASYPDYDYLFEDIFKAAEEKRILLVIDEFPYLANSDKTLMSMLQHMIDKYHEKSKLFLILCGSSISFMENKVLAYKAPLYGRMTGQMIIKSMPCAMSQLFFRNYSHEDKIVAYSIFGGIPAYLNTVDSKKTLKDNVIAAMMSVDGRLYDEPSTLMKEELREPAVYNSVIEAIAEGAVTPNDIATRIHEPKDKVAVYLKRLMELQIVKRQHPVTEKQSTYKSIYSINDNLFRFWYRFISGNKTKIEFDSDKERIFDSLVKPYLDDYVGKIFEDICMEFFLMNISNNDNRLPFSFDKIGRWWGTDPKLKRAEEIDVLMFTSNKQNAFFVECKWRNEKIGLAVLDDLKRKTGLLGQFKHRYYGVFSKSGFKKDLLDFAEANDDVYLYGLQDILGVH